MNYLFQKLTENIKNHTNIIIMTHKNPDLDGMSSAICLYEIIKKLKKNVCIITPSKITNNSLLKGINYLKQEKIEINYISNIKNIKKANNETLLIILDTQKPELVEYEELLKTENIFVLDHHLSTSTHITNTIFEYINSNKSSIVEIMVEYLKYLNMNVNPAIATIMLAGMDIDTHSYKIKTTEATFQASSFLLRNGAKLEIKNELLKETFNDILRRNDYIKNSYFIKKGFLVCNIGKVSDIIDLSIVADELLRVKDVEAAFTVGILENKVIRVSARSTGKIDVNEILQKIGGGGHKTDAAAEFKEYQIEEVIKNIKKAILEE